MIRKIANILFALSAFLFPSMGQSASGIVLPADYKPFYLSSNWRVTPVAVYQTLPYQRAIAFKIDTLDDLGADFITYMRSPRLNLWDGCNPFVVNVHTQNREIFLNDEAMLNIIASLQNYADILCPSARKMLIFGATKPYQITGIDIPPTDTVDSDLFFAARIEKSDDKWSFSPDNVVNLLNNKNNRTQKKGTKQKVMADSQNFAQLKPETLDNPLFMHTAAEISEQPVPLTAVFHVRESAWIDLPFPLKIEGKVKVKEGWYILNGDIAVFNLKEKRKYGISQRLKAGSITINKAVPCQQERCADVTGSSSFPDFSLKAEE